MVRKVIKVLLISALYVSIHYLLNLIGVGSLEMYLSIPLVLMAVLRVKNPVCALVIGVVSIFFGSLSTWIAWPPESVNPSIWLVLLRGVLVGVGGILLKFVDSLASVFPALFWYISGRGFWVFVINYLLTTFVVIFLRKMRKEG